MAGDVSQKEIAEMAGVDQSAISRWKRGGKPDAATAVRFARSANRPPLEALVVMGFITPEEAKQNPNSVIDLGWIPDDMLAEHLRARLEGLRSGDTEWGRHPIRKEEGGQSDAGQAEAEKIDSQGSVTHAEFGERHSAPPDDVAADRQNRLPAQDRDPNLRAQRGAGEENQDPGE